MSTPVALLAFAALFAAWGLVVRASRRASGCGGCSSICHTKEGHRDLR